MINLRRRAVLLTAFSAAALLLRADFAADRWRYRRTIQLSGPAGLARLAVDAETYRLSSRQLADLRVLREGVETPFVLETLGARQMERELSPPVDKAIVSGRGMDLTVDLGGPVRHNQARIETQARNFKKRVEVSTSDDRKNWAIVRDDATIFDDSESDRPSSSLIVHYPATNRRYLKLTILDWTDLKAVSGVRVQMEEEVRARRETVLSKDHPEGKQKSQRSVYELDLGFSGRPHDQVSFKTAPGFFRRSVEILSSEDRKNWSFSGSGVIWRDAERDNSSVDFPEQWGRYLRIELVNHDDQPLAIERMQVLAIAREVHFPAAKTGQYWLYLGNAGASQPVYDLPSVLPEEKDTAERRASLGPVVANPAFKETEKPISDRYPALLYALLGISIVGMGYLAIRLLRKMA